MLSNSVIWLLYRVVVKAVLLQRCLALVNSNVKGFGSYQVRKQQQSFPLCRHPPLIGSMLCLSTSRGIPIVSSWCELYWWAAEAGGISSTDSTFYASVRGFLLVAFFCFVIVSLLYLCIFVWCGLTVFIDSDFHSIGHTLNGFQLFF